MANRESRLRHLEAGRREVKARGRVFIRYHDPALHRHPGGWFCDGEPTEEAPGAGDEVIVIQYMEDEGRNGNT